jgi:hypothetical protein
MSKRVLTTYITDPSKRQPWTGKSLKFLQDGLEESIGVLLTNIIGPTYDSSVGYIAQGCTNSGTASHPNISSGYVYFNGIVYESATFSTILSGSDVVVATIENSYDYTIDPFQFSDGTTASVHQIKRIIWTADDSGTGEFDYDDCEFLMVVPTPAIELKQTVIDIGPWGMDTDASVDVAHGLSNIRDISVIIKDDALTTYRMLNDTNNVTATPQGGWRFDGTNVTLSRLNGGNFDSVSYGATGSFNRGYINIHYLG